MLYTVQDSKCSLTNKHLEDEDPNRPPVTLSSIKPISSLGFQHLGRDVVWGPNSCITVHHASLQHNSRNQNLVSMSWHYSRRSCFLPPCKTIENDSKHSISLAMSAGTNTCSLTVILHCQISTYNWLLEDWFKFLSQIKAPSLLPLPMPKHKDVLIHIT